MNDASFQLPTIWPGPYDAGAAERLIERFAELGRAEARLAKQPAVAALLRALGGNSQYLADLTVREAATLRAILADGPDLAAAEALNELAATPLASRISVASGRWSASPARLATWPRPRSHWRWHTCCAPRMTRANSGFPIHGIRLAAVGSRCSAWASWAPVN
jgi:hypothetical protein